MAKSLFSADLRYRLTEKELLDCFASIDSVKVKGRKINGIITLILAVGFTVLFLADRRAVNYAYLAIMLIIVSALMRFYPRSKYTRAARHAAAENGLYHIRLTDSGQIKGDKMETMNIIAPGNKYFEGDLSFTLVMGKGIRFCIPKSALNERQIELLRAYLSDYGLITVKTGI